ncbi:hypothetical protein [uncultured Winogradskyella sp.]|uniref:hypothetical protein n=1 Tax=uncultured Winogradskyella sp. TaxID=395353 RepID=UPI00262A5EEB|nr:hypothetical protein [uncultured Winogradskyella sp.]
MEFNPHISKSKPVLKESRIILGSFPTWSLSYSELNQTNESKEIIRTKNNDLQFFFGSSINLFWDWYSTYIDNKVSSKDINSIQKSLKSKEIGITDLIISCERKGVSSLDKHLTKRTYNHDFFQHPKKGECLKILCTSKGLMNEMLLNNKFFKIHPELKINQKNSFELQKRIIRKTNGNSNNVKNPFCKSIETEFGGIIECISIPSPGSPYRKLVDFGFDSENSNKFLDNYLNVVFDWFIS